MSGFQRIMHRWLKPRGRHILRTLIITLCAGDPQILSRVRIQRVILRTEHYLEELPFFFFLLFKLTLYLLEYALPPLSWKITPFTRMTLERRLEYLEEWQSSHFYYKRMLCRILTAVCVSHLYSEKRLLTSLGFDSSMQHRAAGHGMGADQ